MLNRLNTFATYGKLFCGIEHSTVDGVEKRYITLLKQSKKELHIEALFEAELTEKLSEKLPKNQHIALVINNDNVLFKTLESEQQEPIDLIQKAFPNIKIEDFYFEILSQNKHHDISLCRKDYVEKLIKTYGASKHFVINISLSNNIIHNTIGFIEHKIVYTSNAKINIDEDGLLIIKKNTVALQNYNVNGLTVSNNYLLSLSAALQPLLQNTNAPKTNFTSKKYNLEKAFKQLRFFNLFIKFGGLSVFLLLIINFILFNYYFSEVSKLNQISQVNNTTKNKMLELKDKVSKKQKTVNDLLKSDGSKSSFYSNSIVHTLPRSILFSEFNYQPLIKRIKDDKSIDIQHNIIILSGSSNNRDDFSNWIVTLEQKKWIDNVQIITYEDVSSTNSNFKLQIKLKHD